MEEITTCLLAARIVPRFIVRSAYPVPVFPTRKQGQTH